MIKNTSIFIASSRDLFPDVDSDRICYTFKSRTLLCAQQIKIRTSALQLTFISHAQASSDFVFQSSVAFCVLSWKRKKIYFPCSTSAIVSSHHFKTREVFLHGTTFFPSTKFLYAGRSPAKLQKSNHPSLTAGIFEAPHSFSSFVKSSADLPFGTPPHRKYTNRTSRGNASGRGRMQPFAFSPC